MTENICPEIRYVCADDGLTLTGCYGSDGDIVLPDEIGGRPFVGIAPYAFAAGSEKTEDERVWQSPDAGFLEPGQKKKLCADLVTQIRLPDGITQIGRYAFYRCINLRKLCLSDALLDVGGGAFNGCRNLREIEINFSRGRRSALKSIVGEVRFALHVRLNYPDGTADLLFPEHYQEAEENTPARILYWVDYGSGGYYRQCFSDLEMDYKAYDELLNRAVTEEEPQTVFRLALGRLMFPYQLSDAAKARYLDYLRDNVADVVLYLTEAEAEEEFRYLAGQDMLTKDAVEGGIDLAAREGKTRMLSMLMDEKKEGKEEKRFEL